MNAAPYRITLGREGKRPRKLSRLVRGENLCGAVLCAQQWTVWGRAEKGRGAVSYAWYRVEACDAESTWHVVSQGTLADARLGWTKEDDARIDAEPDIQPLIETHGTVRHGRARSGRIPGKGKSRLAQLVARVLADKE